MVPGVNINIANGKLGKTPQTKDGIAGLVCTGNTLGNLSTPFRITSLANAATQNIDETTEPFAYKHLKEFYAEAGDGAVIYLLLYPDTVTLVNMVDAGNANNAEPLLDFANGDITLLGVARKPSSEVSVPGNFIRADVTSAITTSSTLIGNYRAAYKPFRLLIEGRTDVTSATIPNLKTNTNNGAAVVLGGTANDGHASVGLALGRLARIPVQRNIGRVKDGVLPITDGYIGATKVEDFTNLLDAVDKGFICLRNYTGRTGLYFSDDPTTSLVTDDFTYLANGRVIDKALRLTYQVYVDELNGEVEIGADGKLPATVCKYIQGKIISTIRQNMSGEISSFNAYVDPDQNVLATSKIEVVEEIVPVGYGKKYEITLGLNNPF